MTSIVWMEAFADSRPIEGEEPSGMKQSMEIGFELGVKVMPVPSPVTPFKVKPVAPLRIRATALLEVGGESAVKADAAMETVSLFPVVPAPGANLIRFSWCCATPPESLIVN